MSDLSVKVDILSDNPLKEDNGVYVQSSKCFDLMGTAEAMTTLQTAWAMLVNGIVVMDFLKKCQKGIKEDNKESVLEPEAFLKLETMITLLDMPDFSEISDQEKILTSFGQGMYYYGLAYELVDEIVSVCICSEDELIKLSVQLELAISNIASGLISLLWESANYSKYREALEIDTTEDKVTTKESYPDCYGKTLKVSGLLQRWVQTIGMNYTEVVNKVAEASAVFTSMNEIMIKYRDKYETLRDMVSGTSYEDVWTAYLEYVMVQDIDCLINGKIELSESYLDRLVTRMDEYTPEKLDLISKLYDIAPLQYELLYKHEG